MQTTAIIPVPKTAAGLPKQPVDIIRYFRQFLDKNLEQATCTRDGKQSLGKWLDRFLAKAEVLQPIDQIPIKPTDKVPFVARCGRLLFLVQEIDDCGYSGGSLLILRGTIIEGFHFNDRGDYKPGDYVSIGPITNHWRRVTLPKPKPTPIPLPFKCSDCDYRGKTVGDVLIHKTRAH